MVYLHIETWCTVHTTLNSLKGFWYNAYCSSTLTHNKSAASPRIRRRKINNVYARLLAKGQTFWGIWVNYRKCSLVFCCRGGETSSKFSFSYRGFWVSEIQRRNLQVSQPCSITLWHPSRGSHVKLFDDSEQDPSTCFPWSTVDVLLLAVTSENCLVQYDPSVRGQLRVR